MAIEIKGSRAGSVGLLPLGGLLIGIGGLLITNAEKHVPIVAPLLFLAVGIPAVLVALRNVIRNAHRVVATEAGISFSGGRLIPWAAIKSIYPASLDVALSGFRTRTQSVAVDFHRRRDVPMRLWIAGMFSVGDVDVPTGSFRPSVLAARLEAMRVQAMGTEDGVTRGESPLPAARVVET